MDTIRNEYVKDVDGGTTAQVRDALYDLMDTFGERAKEAYRKKVTLLREQNPADLDAQQAQLMKQLNATLCRNELTKEKCRRQATNATWREGVPKKEAEEYVRSRWVEYAGDCHHKEPICIRCIETQTEMTDENNNRHVVRDHRDHGTCS